MVFFFSFRRDKCRIKCQKTYVFGQKKYFVSFQSTNQTYLYNYFYFRKRINVVKVVCLGRSISSYVIFDTLFACTSYVILFYNVTLSRTISKISPSPRVFLFPVGFLNIKRNRRTRLYFSR